LARRTFWPGLTALFLLIAYSQTYLTTYAWSDDYPLLASATGTGPDTTDHVIASGRPIYAALLQISFDAAGSVPHLAALRLLGTMGVALVGVVVYASCRRTGLPRPLCSACGAAVGALPAFQTFSGWASAWPFGYACALAGAGGLLLLQRTSLRRGALAAALVLLAFLIYQPAAMCFFVPLAADLAFTDQDWSLVRRRFVAHLLVAASGILLALAAAVSVTKLAGVPVLDRASPVTFGSLPAKLAWFLTRPVAIGARPFTVGSPSPLMAAATAFPVLAVTVAGLLVGRPGRVSGRLKMLAAMATLVPLSVLPNLVVAENQIEFRVLAALAPMMLIYVVAAIVRLVRAFHPADGALAVAACAVAIVAGGLALVHQRALFITPSLAERELFQQALADVRPGATQWIDVVMPSSGWGAHDRLGIYSTTFDITHEWVPVPLVTLTLAERDIPWPASRVRVVSERGSSKQDTVVVDTSPLQSG
jgi:hypothetical protein